MSHDLPGPSYVPFDAPVLEHGRSLWSAPDAKSLAIQSLPCLPVAGEVGELRIRTGTSETLFADRYGGEGVAANGGSGRCGILRGVQVKGVGRTPLAGNARGYFHSYGGLSLQEGILDTIWGEICHRVLPYGAIRVRELYSTQTWVPVRYPKSNRTPVTPRAIAIRENCIRPAHFIRSPFFQPVPGLSGLSGGIDDAARTSAAVRLLPHLLSADSLTLGSQFTDRRAELSPETLADHLRQVFEKASKQLACARARRIMHGSLTPSNHSINGQWLDFTSTTTVSDYGRIVIARGAPDFMSEDRLLYSGLTDFLYCTWKYSQGTQSSFPCYPDWVKFVFPSPQDILRRHFCEELLLLCGVARGELPKLNRQLALNLADTMLEIARAGNHVPFSILSSENNDYIPIMPTQTGAYHLPSILQILASSPDQAWANERLTSRLRSSRLRERLIASWFSLFPTVPEPIYTAERTDFLRVLNAVRLNSAVKDLYRTFLYDRISSVEPGSARAEINDLVAYGVSRLGDIDIDELRVNRGSVDYVAFSPAAGFSISGVRCDFEVGLRVLLGYLDAPPDVFEGLVARNAWNIS